MYEWILQEAEVRIVDGAWHKDRFVAALHEASERLVAVLGWNSPKQLLAHRQVRTGLLCLHARQFPMPSLADEEAGNRAHPTGSFPRASLVGLQPGLEKCLK